MSHKLPYFLLLFFVLFSCKKENENRQVENQRDAKKKEIIFSNINKAWVFYDTPINNTSEATISTWSEWRFFMDELSKKPKKTIGAFQKKSAALSTKATALNANVPSLFNKPQIKSRIAALITKVKMLNMYIHLDQISDQKVIHLISEINVELVSLQREMDKIVEKSKIPVEEGESDLLRMRDTSRAIPNSPLNQNPEGVE